MSRKLTHDEIQKNFINQVWVMIDWWKNAQVSESDKLSGLAHSILAMIDGCYGGIPGFILIPDPHEDDKQYCIEHGENYYPQMSDINFENDIGGSLHSMLYRLTPDIFKDDK